MLLHTPYPEDLHRILSRQQVGAEMEYLVPSFSPLGNCGAMEDHNTKERVQQQDTIWGNGRHIQQRLRTHTHTCNNNTHCERCFHGLYIVVLDLPNYVSHTWSRLDAIPSTEQNIAVV